MKGDPDIFTISSPEIDAKLAQATAVRASANASEKQSLQRGSERRYPCRYSSYVKAEDRSSICREDLYPYSEFVFNDGVIPEQKMRDSVE
jgi:hypothetical protein